MSTDSTQFDLQEAFRALWRRKWVVAGTVVVVTVAAYLFAQATTEQEYRATALVQAKPQQVDLSLVDPRAPVLSSLAPAAREIKTTRFARRAARRLKPPGDPRALLDQVTTRPNDTTGVITITARATSSKRAADIANAFAQTAVRGRVEEARRTLDLSIGQLEGQLRRIGNDRAAFPALSPAPAPAGRARRAGANARVLDPAFRGDPIDRGRGREHPHGVHDLDLARTWRSRFWSTDSIAASAAVEELESLTGLPSLDHGAAHAHSRRRRRTGVASASSRDAEPFRRLASGPDVLQRLRARSSRSWSRAPPARRARPRSR